MSARFFRPGRGLVLAAAFLCTAPLFAAGTYSEGWTFAKLTQFESRGLIFESYEGIVEITRFNEDEDCDENQNQCFTPVTETMQISVRPDNAAAVNFLLGKIGEDVLLRYRVHRIEPLGLETDFEVLEARVPGGSGAPQIAESMQVNKTGSKRNFSMRGRILMVEERGTLIKTNEGVYLNAQTGKVHPFSITSEEMFEYAKDAMQAFQGDYFLGISVAYVTGFRESDYDVFEINRKEAAGGIVPEEDEED